MKTSINRHGVGVIRIQGNPVEFGVVARCDVLPNCGSDGWNHPSGVGWMMVILVLEMGCGVTTGI